MTNGNIRAVVSGTSVAFYRTSDDQLLTSLTSPYFAPVTWPVYGNWSQYYEIGADFSSTPSERIYGLGEHATGSLDNKGTV